MEIGVFSSDKPWALLVFVLVAINALVALTAVAGVETPLDMFATEQSVIPIGDEGAAPAGEMSASIGAAVLSLALWVVILYGLSQGHTWAWWLLAFSAIVVLLGAIAAVLTGTGAALGLVSVLVNLLMFAALFHKQTVSIFRPRITPLPESGLWGTD